GLATAVFRAACGLEPVPSSARVRGWLAAHTAEFAPVLGADPRREPCVVLDLSVGSSLVSGDTAENAEPALTRRIAVAVHSTAEDAEDAEENQLRLVSSASSASSAVQRTGSASSAVVAIGRWDEPRLLYTA